MHFNMFCFVGEEDKEMNFIFEAKIILCTLLMVDYY